MTDAMLLMIGCAVTFTAFAGAYVAIRGGFDESNTLRPQRAKARRAKPLTSAEKSTAA